MDFFYCILIIEVCLKLMKIKYKVSSIFLLIDDQKCAYDKWKFNFDQLYFECDILMH